MFGLHNKTDGTIPLGAVVAMSLIVALVSGTLLWTFWDPSKAIDLENPPVERRSVAEPALRSPQGGDLPETELPENDISEDGPSDRTPSLGDAMAEAASATPTSDGRSASETGVPLTADPSGSGVNRAPVTPESAGLPDAAAGSGRLIPEAETTFWTRDPTPVATERVTLPRLPSPPDDRPYPDILRVPLNVRILDSATFRIADQTYRIRHLAGIDPTIICRDAGLRRWACGPRARIALRNLIAGNILRCRANAPVTMHGKELECRTRDGPELGPQLVLSGNAMTVKDAPPELTELQAAARQAGSGAWAAQNADELFAGSIPVQ